ncbi:polyprenol phosphomannose-dependent alpha 1,6 mannosyltransferase MptB [Sphaerisporangium sp. B11E5]|uniref:polyprenol phosphomannose-dependent alpha 1,6 mannosyltransferase MptB n=1 Tax=Sphaerisporangium sp. B11E5 TaxID=3153563 RepID=UPI00325DE7AF
MNGDTARRQTTVTAGDGSLRAPEGGGTAARVAVLGIGAAIVLTAAIGVLGASAVVPGLAGAWWHPPFSLAIRPGGHLVIAMEAAAILLGGAGLGAGLLALRRGWAPDPRVLLVCGCLAAGLLAFLPPSGSADHLNYAAYGRMVVLGHDPYATGAADLPADPVAGAVELPWREEPSLYGPLATAVQAVASLVGGESVRLTVFALALANVIAFLVTALLLHRLASGDRTRQARAALLWTVNPLVLYQLVAGMHVDTQAIVFVTAALLAGRGDRWWTAGPLLGLGIATKANAGLVALGTAWELRRSPRRLAVVAGTALATVVAAYLLAGPNSLDQILHASKSISWATPWHLAQRALQLAFGSGAYRSWIQAASLLTLVALAVVLFRALRPHLSHSPTARRGDGRTEAMVAGTPIGGMVAGGGTAGVVADPRAGGVVAAVVVVAWLFATPYALPWYDGLAFALLATVPATALDGFLVARVTVLSLAYLPARQQGQPPDLGWLVTVVRGQVVPWILLGLTIALAGWAVRAAGRRRSRPRG